MINIYKKWLTPFIMNRLATIRHLSVYCPQRSSYTFFSFLFLFYLIVLSPSNTLAGSGNAFSKYFVSSNPAGDNCSDLIVNISSTQQDILCNGASTGSIDITASDGIEPYTYMWAGTGVNPTAEDQSGLAAGVYSVTVTDNAGMTATLELTITEPTPVVVNSINANSPLCAGGNLNLTTTASGGTGTLAYAWSGPNGFSSAIQNPTIPNITTAGTGTYTVTVTDDNDCTAEETISVTVNALPTITVTPSAPTICNGSSVVLTASGASTYTWSPSTGLSETTGPTVTANPSSTTTYTVTGTDANGCMNTTTVTVTVNNVTAGVIAADQTICSGGDPVAFTQTTAATGSGTLTYEWQSNTTGCGGTWSSIPGATGTTYDIPAGLATTTYYRRVVTSTLNGVSCSISSNCLTVNINNVTAGSIAADQTICSGGDPAAFTEATAATGSVAAAI